MEPTWGPTGSCRPQMGPMLGPWTLLSGNGMQYLRNKMESMYTGCHGLGIFSLFEHQFKICMADVLYMFGEMLSAFAWWQRRMSSCNWKYGIRYYQELINWKVSQPSYGQQLYSRTWYQNICTQFHKMNTPICSQKPLLSGYHIWYCWLVHYIIWNITFTNYFIYTNLLNQHGYYGVDK